MVKLHTSLGRRTDNKRCFKRTEYYYIILGFIIFGLVFLNMYQLLYNNGYNLIKYSDYYSESPVVQNSDIIGKNFSMNNFIINQDSYITTLQSIGGGVYRTVVSDATTRTYLKSDSMTSLTYMKRYQVDNKLINDINFFLMSGLPINLFYTENDYNFTVNPPTTIYKGFPIISMIPSNWSSFWDNLEVVFYIVDTANNGFAYNFGRNESSNVNDYTNKLFHLNDTDITVKLFNVNVSCESIMLSRLNMYYHDLPLPSKYQSQYFSYVTSSFLNDFIGLFQTNDNMFYDHTLSHSVQLRGYYTVSDIFGSNGFTPKEVGWYIKMNNGFNLTQNIDDSYKNAIGINVDYVNGFVVTDTGLFVGNRITVDDKVNTVLITDITIVSLAIATLIVLYIYPSQSKNDFKKGYKDCFVHIDDVLH